MGSNPTLSALSCHKGNLLMNPNRGHITPNRGHKCTVQYTLMVFNVYYIIQNNGLVAKW